MIFRKKQEWDDQYDDSYVQSSDRQDRPTGHSTIWIHLLVFAISFGLLLASVGWIHGQLMFEKTLTALASPLGLVWFLLIVLIYFGFLFKQTFSGFVGLTCWLVLTICGNSYVANHMMQRLEQPFLESNLEDFEKLDVVFVLGGGTTTSIDGREQLGIAGDRVVTAAKLYHLGMVDLLVCTGRQWVRSTSQDLHPYEEAKRLLVSLDVPESAIATIGGENTAQEMSQAATFLQQQNLSGARIGIITSAWHASRVERLAKKNQLAPVMVPADFRSRFFVPGPDLFVPSTSALRRAGIYFKETLAGLIGR